MKPDWKDAPEWANWLAWDKSEGWWWYENEPKYDPRWNVWIEPYGMAEDVEAPVSGYGTLEARP